MKYCVFGFKKEFPKVAKSKNNLSPDPFSLSTSAIAYEKAINSGEYAEVYFLVDFGYAEVPFWRAVDVDYFGDTVTPWILISMCEVKKNKAKSNPMISKLTLKLKGFSEEYKNIYAGMSRFDYYMESNLKCDLYAEIFQRPEKFITSTNMEIHRQKEQKFYCRKYRI